MTVMRARWKAAEGPAAVWDPADQEEFRRLAGDQFVRVEGDVAVVLTEGGYEVRVFPGWYVIAPGGPGKVTFHTPERVEVLPAA